MEKRPLYTIGHGNKSPEYFLSLLKEFEIEYLIDVRSKPYSKYNQSFNQNDLKLFLEANEIKYVFMGDLIGGRPNDPSCYDSAGKVDYELLMNKPYFQQGIERLKVAYSNDVSAVIMCSESDPCQCHRTKLIGRVLQKEDVMLAHVDEKGQLKDQSAIIQQLNRGLSEIDLFGNVINSTSRKIYNIAK